MSEPSRIVIRTPNWLGDVVMALPAMTAVRRHFPTAALAVAVPSSFAPLFKERTEVDPQEVLAIDRSGGTSSEARALASGRFEVAILFPNSLHSAWIAKRAGISERWGYGGRLRGWLLTRKARRTRSQHLHQRDYYQALVGGLGIEPAAVPPRIEVTDATRQRACATLADLKIDPSGVLIGFAPGAAYGHAKRWPPARVAEVIARLTIEQHATCILFGAADDRDAGREIESALNRGQPSNVRALNLIGRTDLRLLLGLISFCRAFVSNDSGAMHLAAALGVPITAIFGPTDERATAPIGDHDILTHPVFCRPCMLRDCPIDHRCMKGIQPDAVVAAVTGQLHKQLGGTL